MIVVQCAVVYLLERSVHTDHRTGEGVDFKLNQQQGALELVHPVLCCWTIEEEQAMWNSRVGAGIVFSIEHKSF